MSALNKAANNAKVAQAFVMTYEIVNNAARTCLDMKLTCDVKTISLARRSSSSKLAGSSSSS